MSAYARDIADLCKGLDVPPILIGHSMGGLVAQMAARLVPTKAVVLLAPSPPWGVSGSSFEEAVTAFGVQMAGAFWGQGVSADPTLMRTYSLDRMPRAERDATIKRLVPESGRALTETLNWWIDPFMTTGVGSGGLGSPTLVMVGQKDMVHPPATAHLIAERLGASFIEMPGMSHWLLGEEGWEDVADRAMGWMSDLQT